jgi:hypothetical protein
MLSIVGIFAALFGRFCFEAGAVNTVKFQKTSVPKFFADAFTEVIRNPDRTLVRVDTSTAADLDRASRLGIILQNFGSFAVVSKLSKSEEFAALDKPLESSISLPGETFDPLKTSRAESIFINSRTEPGYFIIQFGGIVTDEWLNDMRAIGVEILQYVPHQAFLVYAPADAIVRAATHPRVRWIGRFLPNEKLSPVLDEQVASAIKRRKMRNGISSLNVGKSGSPTFDIAVFARADSRAVANEIETHYSGSNVQVILLSNNFFNIVRAELPLEQLAAVAEIPDVVRIDSTGIRSPEDERAAQIVAGNYSNPTTISSPGYDPLALFGVDGTGVTVAVADDGISIPGNGGFYITASNTKDGPMHGAPSGAMSGHGHLNASIIAGSTPFGNLDPLGYNYGLGIAPNSNILNIPLLVPGYGVSNATSFDDTVSTTGVNGVRATISNNSWGEGVNLNGYDSMAAEFDGYARDASIGGTIDPLLLVFSAGNAGPSPQSLTRPKVAKNIIAVGNTENLRTELGFSDADNMDDLNSSSSRGPAADGRVKPDITAPGTFITGGRPAVCTLLVNCFEENHAVGVGTSHAAPQVAGAAALFTQFWKNTNLGQNPSPALIKAAVINSAQDMNGSATDAAIPNGNEGWGRLNMKQMFAPNLISYVDTTATLADPGDAVTYNGTVIDPNKPVRITLVWTDPPAVGDPALVNDLDLAVTIGSSTYRGNNFSGGISTTGGLSNSIDNVENVFLLAGNAAGTHVSVTVTAAALNGDGILGNADLTDQSYALVLYNFAINPTAAPADIDGRITDQIGRGIGRTIVLIRSSDGSFQASALTNSFGYYHLSNVPTGHSYIVTPRNKKYTFDPPSIIYNHLDQVSGLNFRAVDQ